jgi:hypothetical protein
MEPEARVGRAIFCNSLFITNPLVSINTLQLCR